MPGSIISGIFAGKAAKTQAKSAEASGDVQLEMLDKSIDAQREMFDISVGLSEPWRAKGEDALGALGFELGLNELPTFGGETASTGGATSFGVGDSSFDTRAGAEAFRSTLLDSGGSEPHQPATASLVWDDKEGLWARPSATSPWPQQPGQQQPGQQSQDIPQIIETTTGGTETTTEGIPYAGFQKTPGYEFQLDEGQRAINRSLAARGKVLSGPAVKEGLRFSQGLADQTYTNHLKRLANLAGLGSGVAGQQGGFAVQTGQGMASAFGTAGVGVGHALTDAGNARASGYIATGQAISGGFNFLGGLAGSGAFGSNIQGIF